MAHPLRDPAAAVVQPRCLLAAGKPARVGRRHRSLPSPMGSRYSARLLMTPAAGNALRAPIGNLSDRGKAPAIGKIATAISHAGAGVVGASTILRVRPL